MSYGPCTVMTLRLENGSASFLLLNRDMHYKIKEYFDVKNIFLSSFPSLINKALIIALEITRTVLAACAI